MNPASETRLSADQRLLARSSLADAVYETLVEAIVRGQLGPGTALSAAALAEQLQVSRTPVTEALQRLAHDGLVEQRLNHQPRVATLSRQDVVEIYQLRKCLEGAAAEQTAAEMSDEAIAQLDRELRAVQRSRREVDWTERAIEFDVRFHRVLADAAGNRRLTQDIERYRRLVRCFCRMTGSESNLRAAMDEHATILAAIKHRKPAAARRAMIAHIDNRLEAVLATLYS